MHEMGQWQEPDIYSSLARLYDEIGEVERRDGRPTLAVFLEVASQRGMLVRTDYYVPDPDELYSAYYRMRHDLSRNGRGWRWVMCSETFEALKLVFGGKVVAEPIDINPLFLPENSSLVVQGPPRAQKIIENHGSLFGIEIRIDPAARRPMFEIHAES